MNSQTKVGLAAILWSILVSIFVSSAASFVYHKVDEGLDRWHAQCCVNEMCFSGTVRGIDIPSSALCATSTDFGQRMCFTSECVLKRME